MQRGVGNLVVRYYQLTTPFAYGLVEAGLSPSELRNNGKVCFQSLRAIMRSGLEVDYTKDAGSAESNAELDANSHPLDVNDALQESKGDPVPVLLGIPRWHSDQGNTINTVSDGKPLPKLLYRVKTEECLDENDGRNSRTIGFRMINARLLLGKPEDHPDFETLPLMRVKRTEGFPAADHEFVPPCLVAGASPVLQDLLKSIASHLQAKRRDAAEAMSQRDFNRMVPMDQLRHMMRFRTLNRYSGYLPALVEARGVTPFTLFRELNALLGEAEALFPEVKKPELPAFDHDTPFQCFRDLRKRIEDALEIERQPYFKVICQTEPNEIALVADLDDEHLQSDVYYLGIEQTKIRSTVLTDHVLSTDRFRVLPYSQRKQAIRGIPLSAQHAPKGLPITGDLYFFELDISAGTGAEMWTRIKSEKKLAVSRGSLPENDWTGAVFAIYIPEKPKH
jgi:type VI secretion system protein ImpJ